jgi:pimeloyl-ACP methyl ester carboxylesterase
MRGIEVETALGRVWFWGRDRGLPMILVISGFRAPRDVWHQTGLIKGIDYFRTHLPGNYCPPLAEVSIEAYARALDDALAARFPDRPILALGISAGALVALSLKTPGVRRLVLLEPPLRSPDYWPLHGAADTEQGLTGNELEQLRQLFGISSEGIAPRDYTPLIDELRVPAHVILGDPPPPPGTFGWERIPSLVGPEARALLSRSPLVRTTTLEGHGHGIQVAAFQPCARIMFDEAKLAFDDAAPDAG